MTATKLVDDVVANWARGDVEALGGKLGHVMWEDARSRTRWLGIWRARLGKRRTREAYFPLFSCASTAASKNTKFFVDLNYSVYQSNIVPKLRLVFPKVFIKRF